MGAILDHLIQDHGATKDQAEAALGQWTVRPMMHNGVQVGETMMQNNEIHFALDADFRLKMGRRKMLQDVVTGLLKENKFLVTKLYRDSKEAALVRAFGFTKTHSDETYDYYWMNEGDPIRTGSRLKEETL